MRPKTRSCVPACVIAIALVDIAAAAAQEASSRGRPEGDGASIAGPAALEQPWLVRIPDPLIRRATVSGLSTAVARFKDSACRKILLDFADRDGRPLEDRLASLQVDFDQYVSMLVFYDGSRSSTCNKGAMAFTTPGSRVVYVCVDQVKHGQWARPEQVTSALIHEILHTLGLPENPPSSDDITRRVLARCGRPPNRRSTVWRVP